MGRPPYELPIVSRSFSSVDLPNLQRAIEEYGQEHGVEIRPLGYTGGTLGPFDTSLANLIGKDGWLDSTRIGPVQYQMVDVDVDRRMQCLQTGIHLVDARAGRIAAHVRRERGDRELEVITTDRARATAFVEEIRERAHRSNVYRGKVISLGVPQDIRQMMLGGCGDPTIAFHRFPTIHADEIILPEATMQLVQRNTVGFLQQKVRVPPSFRS